MDGLPTSVLPTERGLQATTVRMQRTLRAAIGCAGIGLHGGRPAVARVLPAAADSGIAFRRTDLNGTVAARHDHVADTTLCTVLADPARPELRVGTVEHVLSALAGLGIGNAVVEVDGPEMPILDGSAADWVFLLDCAGVAELDAPAPVIEVTRAVRVEQGSAFAELRPASFGFDMALSIAFDSAAIGRQALSLRLSEDAYRDDLARARTFAELRDVERLRAAGLGLGGGFHNAVVVDDRCVLNPGGLRMADEFVRHKMLDAVGDLALAGATLRGRFIGHCSGHTLNNRLLRALFADASAWRLAQPAAWDSLASAA